MLAVIMEAPKALVAFALPPLPLNVVAYNGCAMHPTGIMCSVSTLAPLQGRMEQYKDIAEPPRRLYQPPLPLPGGPLHTVAEAAKAVVPLA